MTKIPPSIVAIEEALNSIHVNGRIRVSISQEQLRLLLGQLLDFVMVDEAWYLNQYPQARESVARGEYPSAKEHFHADGYFKGYLPYPVAVDEEWYKSQYRDIQMAVEAGNLASLQQHFASHGYREGRFPNSTVAARLSALLKGPAQQTSGKINIALISSPSLESAVPATKRPSLKATRE
ncbi:hypothetical protein [Nitrospirillum bahiense]|uniref:Uncharacterized protein n=1 Tax=Nitrospirillum amazonense TaxID=28077 RepID=A0A560FJ62_9PROT|nr:hypothetical protein [Nitrospirillum amazonense]TWB21651.1 hypothetical protein FBZ88_1175 [Nitrospirillum amazonense]